MSISKVSIDTISVSIYDCGEEHVEQNGIKLTDPSEPLSRLAAMVAVTGDGRKGIPVHAPFTGKKIATVPACTADDVQAVLHRARKAQQAWAQRSTAERKAILLRYHDRVLQFQDELLDIIQIETGKARVNAMEELLDLANNARHYAYRAHTYLKPRRRKGAFPFMVKTWEYHHPIGIVGIIAPWNYPLVLTISDAIPALLAGNAVILKPSRETPFTALLAVHLLREAGLPNDVCQVVTGHGGEVGPPLIAGVDFLGFTGSTETGKNMASQAGKNLIKCSLELGGKNPMIVLNDAPFSRAVEGAIHGCFANAGQLCISIERLYLQSGIYNRFIEEFARKTRVLRLAASFDYDSDVGSLISEKQLSIVQAHIQDAIEKGAKIIAGGHARPDIGPFFYEPTILTGVTPAMKVAREETFGPVVSVYRFNDINDAVSAANDSEYGLNGSIWSRNLRHTHKIAQQIACGTVNINEAYAAAYGSVDAPMGGTKRSGIGRRHGREGFLKYTETQTIAVQRFLSMAPPPGMDAKRHARIMTKAMRILVRVPGLR
jgi:succinate-semialdehyde dehydrogenase/glutarate-semialdehyde dehydrogenase